MRFEIVVMGTSLGGMKALEVVLGALPTGFPLPLAVVQHRSAEEAGALRAVLHRHVALPLKEPHDKEPVSPGSVYLAPADYHLLIDNRAFALSTGAPVSYARPSVDVLFESAADEYGSGVVAVVLTGANRDGARGCAAVKERGGVVIVQDPATADSRAMPEAAMAATRVDRVLAMEEIAPFLVNLCGRGAR